MKIRVLGIMPLNFTTEDGSTINGTKLYVAYENPNVDGLQTDDLFVKEDIILPEDLKPNSVVNAEFSPKGKLLSISTK